MGRTEEMAALVQKAIDGDEAALECILAVSRPRIRSLVEDRIPADLARTIDPDDIVQESHIEVFRRIGDFELRTPDAFERWIAAVTLNRLRSQITRSRAKKRGGDRKRISRVRDDVGSTMTLLKLLSIDERSPGSTIVQREVLAAVESSFRQLPAEQREAIRLVHLRGLSVAEAAAKMDKTERAIHGLCRRGLRQLGRILREHPAVYESWM